MKRINFWFSVLLSGVFGIYLFFGSDLNHASSTLYASYYQICYCDGGELCCQDEEESVAYGYWCTSDPDCASKTNEDCDEAWTCSDNEFYDGCHCQPLVVAQIPYLPSDSCTAIDGECSTITGECVAGSATTVATQTTSTGLNNVWSCVGSCGGGTATCSTTKCINAAVINGACKSNITSTGTSDLCYQGTPSYSSSDANHDYINDSNESQYIWSCLGSSGVCAEGDGTDALNCISVIDQEAWFQVNDGSILSNGTVSNYVPITTCDSSGNNCSSTVNNGTVFAKKTSSVSGFDKAKVTSNSDFNFKDYTYSQLKTQYFDSKGVGTVFSSSDSWSKIKETNGVVFIDGDLEINSDLDTSNFVMIVAKGTITVDPSVNKVNAILVGNKVVAVATDDGSTDAVSQLVINGMVYGASGVEFSRSLYPKNLNNTSPSVVVNYNPGLLFMVPNELSKAFSQWKIN